MTSLLTSKRKNISLLPKVSSLSSIILNQDAQNLIEECDKERESIERFKSRSLKKISFHFHLVRSLKFYSSKDIPEEDSEKIETNRTNENVKIFEQPESNSFGYQ